VNSSEGGLTHYTIFVSMLQFKFTTVSEILQNMNTKGNLPSPTYLHISLSLTERDSIDTMGCGSTKIFTRVNIVHKIQDKCVQ